METLSKNSNVNLIGKRILIGITGSIAAYKINILTRLLIKEGWEVKIIMTPSARDFVSPLTLSVLSKNKVLWNFAEEDLWNNHIELGSWADFYLIAPASANTISKMAYGMADNLLLTIYLSSRCSVGIAPAMDVDMWHHKTTQENILKLKSQGVKVFDIEIGELASGLLGEGRMMEPERILEILKSHFITKDLANKKVLITAGPTHEYLDPVRFLGNASSGKMGASLANQCKDRGAEVTVIAGPCGIKLRNGIKIEKVTSANEMFLKAESLFKDFDIVIFAAAVADYMPKTKNSTKIKKKGDELTLELVKTSDIAKNLGSKKKDGQLFIGFALETDNEFNNAVEKMKNKNFDLIVLNSLRDEGAGFGYDTNKITLIRNKDNKKINFELKSKDEVAQDIVDEIIKLF